MAANVIFFNMVVLLRGFEVDTGFCKTWFRKTWFLKCASTCDVGVAHRHENARELSHSSKLFFLERRNRVLGAACGSTRAGALRFAIAFDRCERSGPRINRPFTKTRAPATFGNHFALTPLRGK
jgi:hypothetical protein